MELSWFILIPNTAGMFSFYSLAAHHPSFSTYLIRHVLNLLSILFSSRPFRHFFSFSDAYFHMTRWIYGMQYILFMVAYPQIGASFFLNSNKVWFIKYGRKIWTTIIIRLLLDGVHKTARSWISIREDVSCFDRQSRLFDKLKHDFVEYRAFIVNHKKILLHDLHNIETLPTRSHLK